MVRFLTFENYHGKQNIGSTYIRVHQLLKYWPEADIYKYGENPDVLVFQKVYCGVDYKFPAHFEGKKILDMCDPDWLQGRVFIKETIEAVDAITCPTEGLQKFIQQMTDKPVVVIPDRFDTELLPKPKKHTGQAKTVVWFGYRHNSEVLKPALKKIDELNLNLIIIAEDNPLFDQYSTRKNWYTYHKYDEYTFYEIMQQADYALLPDGNRPQDRFKSGNKTVKSILAGLPVAKTPEEMDLFTSGKERQSYLDKHYDIIKTEHDVRQSVKDMKELIEKL